MLRSLALGILLLVLSSCTQSAVDIAGASSSLTAFSSEELASRLASSDRPLIINVWASWCIPCRSEAPHFVAAHSQFGDEIDFVGVAVRDTDADARRFLSEFGITYENLLDPGEDVRKVLSGSGVSMTYFIAPGGEVVATHFGVIDEGALALSIDELLRRS